MSNLVIFGALLALWLCLSGHWTPLMIALGAASAGATVMLINRMQSIVPWPESHRLVFYLRMAAHFVRLLWSMLLSSLRVVALVFRPASAKTAFMEAPLAARTPLGQLVRSNSITLTPGTISVEMNDSSILMHVLDKRDNEAELQKADDEKARRLED